MIIKAKNFAAIEIFFLMASNTLIIETQNFTRPAQVGYPI